MVQSKRITLSIAIDEQEPNHCRSDLSDDALRLRITSQLPDEHGGSFLSWRGSYELGRLVEQLRPQRLPAVIEPDRLLVVKCCGIAATS